MKENKIKPIPILIAMFLIFAAIILYVELRTIDRCVKVDWGDNPCDSHSLYRIKIFDPVRTWYAKRKILVGEFTARCISQERKFYRLKHARSISYIAVPNSVAPITDTESYYYDYDSFLVPIKQADVCQFEVMR